MTIPAEIKGASEVVIGVDTSNYTTSLALLSLEGELLANLKMPLPVKAGERGLRQSEALFNHIKSLPELIERLKPYLVGKTVKAIGVSERPRNHEGSYMPCFLAGVCAAESLGATAGIPVFRFSHQCGHIMAALFSSGALELAEVGSCFGAYHVSGGTTELVRVEAVEDGFICEVVGGTKDLNAGQVIDRIAVAAGLPFPGGAHLERCALEFNGRAIRRKPPVDGCYFNLSGLENLAMGLYRDTDNLPLTASFVFDYVGTAIARSCESYLEKYGNGTLVFAGGVMSNTCIRKRLENAFDSRFAEPALSCDNAVGIAALALRRLKKNA